MRVMLKTTTAISATLAAFALAVSLGPSRSMAGAQLPPGMSVNAGNALLPDAINNLLGIPNDGDCAQGSGGVWVASPCPGGSGGGNVTLNSSALLESLPNSPTGTTQGSPVVFTNGAQIRDATTSDSDNVIGVCTSGCGTSGTAQVAISGQTVCAFDGPTSAGDFVVNSSTVNGECSDSGSGVNVPAGIQVIGYVQSTNAGPGSYSVDMSDAGIAAALSKKAKAGGSNGQVQYNSGGGAFGGIANTSCNGSGNCSWGGIQTFSGVLGSARQVTGTTDTLSTSDCGTEIVYNNAGTISVTTIPNIAPNQICAIALHQEGAGSIQINNDGGLTTLVSTNNSCPSSKSSGQYATMSVEIQPFNPSEYKVGGDCS